MFHRAIDLQFQDGTIIEVTFLNGEVKSYDMSNLFIKYPQLMALQNRDLFLSGKLMGSYGIVWNDELDIETETIYEEGKIIRIDEVPAGYLVGEAVCAARARAGMSQMELAKATGIDQSDISKIERGIANPSVSTLNRIAKALGANLSISIA